MESRFNMDIIRANPSYLKDSRSKLDSLESGDLCSLLVGDRRLLDLNINLTQDECDVYLNGILKTSLTNIL